MADHTVNPAAGDLARAVRKGRIDQAGGCDQGPGAGYALQVQHSPRVAPGDDVMDPLMIIAAGVGLVVGAVVAWSVRGARLKRAQAAHDVDRGQARQALAYAETRLKTAEAERDVALGERDQAVETLRQSQETRIREQTGATELLTTTEGRLDRLSAEIGQLREQLDLAQQDLAAQRNRSADLGDQVESLGEEVTTTRAKLDARQHEMVELQRERDALRDQLSAAPVGRRPTGRSRHWRIDTFFNG